MRRLLALLVVLLGVSWLAAGCGKSSSSTSSSKGTPPPGYEGMEKRLRAEKGEMLKKKMTPRSAAPQK